MNSAIAAATFLTCLLLVITVQVSGQSAGSSRCSCFNFIKPDMNFLLSMKLKLDVLEPSSYCPRREIIVTSANSQKKCVDPNSRVGLMLLSKHRLALKDTASKAVASSQTSTLSSTQTSQTSTQSSSQTSTPSSSQTSTQTSSQTSQTSTPSSSQTSTQSST